MDARDDLRLCPHCNSHVRQDRLQKHITSIHRAPLDVFEASAIDARRTVKPQAAKDDSSGTTNNAAPTRMPLFDAKRDGFQTPKLVENGMRREYRRCRDRLIAALDKFESVELAGIVTALRAASDLAAALQEIIDYRGRERAKTDAAKEPPAKRRKPPRRTAFFVATGQTRKVGGHRSPA